MNTLSDISCIRVRQEALDRLEKEQWKANKSNYQRLVQNVRICLRRIRK